MLKDKKLNMDEVTQALANRLVELEEENKKLKDTLDSYIKEADREYELVITKDIVYKVIFVSSKDYRLYSLETCENCCDNKPYDSVVDNKENLIIISKDIDVTRQKNALIKELLYIYFYRTQSVIKMEFSYTELAKLFVMWSETIIDKVKEVFEDIKLIENFPTKEG